MRAGREIEKRILELIEPQAESMGFELVRIRVMGGNTPTLQLMAEKSDGTMGVDDCADLSRAISPLLDVADVISGKYTLEVSTPGIDRPLTRQGDFGKWIGHAAKVELTYPIEGRKRFTGVITAEDAEGNVILQLDEETELETHVSEMSKASLILTDELIEAARARGQMPVQPDENDMDGLEIDDSIDDEDETLEEDQTS